MTDGVSESKITVYCCGFYFNPETTEVLLLRKARPDWQRGRYNGIGGHVEHNETVHQAMAREFKEETGVAVPTERWDHFAQLNGRGFKVLFFRADRLPDDGEPVGSEDEPVAWFSEAAIPPTALPNLYWLLPMSNKRSAHDWPYRIDEKWFGYDGK